MKRGRWSTPLLVAAFFLGLGLLLYPSVSDYWNSIHQSRAISQYADEVAALDRGRYEQLWADAQAFNAQVPKLAGRFTLSEAERAEYDSLLNLSGAGIIGYIEIPVIDCFLPIYHGVEESVLQIGVGHMEWSSLPVGGQGSHCVLTGHRGLPSSKLFTNLDKMELGDVFVLHVLDEALTYEVDQILEVEPSDTDELMVEKGQDYCTLVTCTPYGVNSHRLLVRGHRVENGEKTRTIRVIADAMQVKPMAVAPLVMAPVLLLLLGWLLIWDRHKRR